MKRVQRTYLDQGYVQRIRAAIPALPPGVVMVTVAHDDWCPLLNGTGTCTCNPDIVYEHEKHFPPGASN